MPNGTYKLSLDLKESDVYENIEGNIRGMAFQSIAFDTVNEISDLYGNSPNEANAMIKGVRYLLGNLYDAGLII